MEVEPEQLRMELEYVIYVPKSLQPVNIIPVLGSQWPYPVNIILFTGPRGLHSVKQTLITGPQRH